MMRGMRRLVAAFTACLLAAAVVMTACGCSSNSQYEYKYAEDEHPGFGQVGDTAVKDGPVEITLYVDDAFRYDGNPVGTGKNSLERLEERYQAQKGRSQVTFNNVYLPHTEIERMVREGFDGVCDGVIADSDLILQGCDAGTIEPGRAGLSVRRDWYHFQTGLLLIRRAGSDEDLPPAATLNGKSDMQFNSIQQIPKYDGVIAVAEDSTREGSWANRVLADEGLYSSRDGVGGTYADSIIGKIKVYPDQAAVAQAVINGECQLGWVLCSHPDLVYPGVESVTSSTGSGLACSLATPTNAPEPGVARDFFECIIHMD